MTPLCEGRVAVVTGAGRGIGRAHAVALAAEGAHVVVNDLVGDDGDHAAEVVREITARGGSAVSNTDDVSTEVGARALIDSATSTFGRIDVLVNNAGILRDAMIFSMATDAWDSVIAVHLRSTFLTTRHVTSLWRNQAKAGQAVDARIVNTTSVAGLYGHVGQSNYVAAKAGIAAFSLSVAREVSRYGVTVNALSPGAATRMTENLIDAATAATLGPERVARVLVWLASTESTGVTGRVIHVAGDTINVADGWSAGATYRTPADAGPREVGTAIRGLLTAARPAAGLDGVVPAVRG